MQEGDLVVKLDFFGGEDAPPPMSLGLVIDTVTDEAEEDWALVHWDKHKYPESIWINQMSLEVVSEAQ